MSQATAGEATQVSTDTGLLPRLVLSFGQGATPASMDTRKDNFLPRYICVEEAEDIRNQFFTSS